MKLDFDIVAVVETKLKNENTLTLKGYTYISHNRNNIRVNDDGSGGVGIFVKNAICDDFDVNIFDKTFKDVLCVEFVDRVSKYSFCYMCMLLAARK